MLNPSLVELLARYGPETPLRNRIMILLALDSGEGALVDPDVPVLAKVCRVKQSTIRDAIGELEQDGWLEPELSGFWRVNPFPACTRSARSKRNAHAGTLPLVPPMSVQPFPGPTGINLKLEPVSPTLAVKRYHGRSDCTLCAGTGWLEIMGTNEVGECPCVEGISEAHQRAETEGTQPKAHSGAQGDAGTQES